MKTAKQSWESEWAQIPLDELRIGNLKVGTENTAASEFYINPSPEMSDGNE